MKKLCLALVVLLGSYSLLCMQVPKQQTRIFTLQDINPIIRVQIPEEDKRTVSAFLNIDRTQKDFSDEEYAQKLTDFDKAREVVFEAFAQKFRLDVGFFGDRYQKFVDPDKKIMKAIGSEKTILPLSKFEAQGKKTEISELKKELSRQYKIHLMPKWNEVISVVTQLLNELKENTAFGQALDSFKVQEIIVQDDSAIRSTKQDDIFPRIVLYPGNSKQQAQTVLDIVYKIFKDKEGIGTPRFSKRVTSLISYAQGDSDHKKQDRFKHHYEQPNLVHYAPDFTPEGANNGYHLTVPK